MKIKELELLYKFMTTLVLVVVVEDQLERAIKNIQMFIVDPYQLNVNCL